VQSVKTVTIKTTGHDKSHCTDMLSCTSDDEKLPLSISP